MQSVLGNGNKSQATSFAIDFSIGRTRNGQTREVGTSSLELRLVCDNSQLRRGDSLCVTNLADGNLSAQIVFRQSVHFFGPFKCHPPQAARCPRSEIGKNIEMINNGGSLRARVELIVYHNAARTSTNTVVVAIVLRWE